jgi:hypothetical protein
MTDRNKFEQMLEFLVNEDQAKAKEMFHQIVVEKSREIYENLLSEEFDEDVEEGQKEDEDGMEEAMADDEDDGMEEGMDEETDEGFDMSMEADDEDDGMPELDGGADGMPSMDGGDDFKTDMQRDDPQEIVGDMSAAVDDLDSLVAELEDAIAAFDGGAGSMDDEGDEEPKEQYAFEDETLVREYVEKVGEAYKGGKAAGTSESSGTNAKSIVAKKNDMGGVAAMAKGGEGGGNKTSLPGHSNAKTDNGGNVNVPGGKAGVKHLKTVPAGHGAEKKGSGDTATNKKSLIGSR